mmetsp:Transcript_72328/g.209383  ORF Transcript_72328/g.209383 Transcript_72328/m.209383 type:complete len:206 (-) Transcript_72328:397-1014(-)
MAGHCRRLPPRVARVRQRRGLAGVVAVSGVAFALGETADDDGGRAITDDVIFWTSRGGEVVAGRGRSHATASISVTFGGDPLRGSGSAVVAFAVRRFRDGRVARRNRCRRLCHRRVGCAGLHRGRRPPSEATHAGRCNTNGANRAIAVADVLRVGDGRVQPLTEFLRLATHVAETLQLQLELRPEPCEFRENRWGVQGHLLRHQA